MIAVQTGRCTSAGSRARQPIRRKRTDECRSKRAVTCDLFWLRHGQRGSFEGWRLDCRVVSSRHGRPTRSDGFRACTRVPAAAWIRSAGSSRAAEHLYARSHTTRLSGFPRCVVEQYRDTVLASEDAGETRTSRTATSPSSRSARPGCLAQKSAGAGLPAQGPFSFVDDRRVTRGCWSLCRLASPRGRLSTRSAAHGVSVV
jgi:hypothetical protein